MSTFRRFRDVTLNAFFKKDHVITAPRDVTPKWLTAVLNRHASYDDVEVSSLRVILSKRLAASTVHRLALEYRNGANAQTGPRTLFLKLGTPLSPNDGPADICRAEVDFYTKVAPAMSCPPLVRVYDAAFSPVSERSHILLEDLSQTHSQQAENTAPSAEVSRLAVVSMGRVHAQWWNDPRLGNGIGTVFSNEWLASFLSDLNTSVAEFIESASSELTAKQKDSYRLMLNAAPRIWGRLTDAKGLTVTHGDAHWWNFLYPNDAAVHAVRMFDWQLWHIDLGARDLAFLLALGGFANPRPGLEADLLRVYHDTLIENGVTGYSWEMLNEDYRWSAIRNLNIPVIFRSRGKHESTWKTALQRAFDSYERLGCAELL